jgi:hypothetical protein
MEEEDRKRREIEERLEAEKKALQEEIATMDESHKLQIDQLHKEYQEKLSKQNSFLQNPLNSFKSL